MDLPQPATTPAGFQLSSALWIVNDDVILVGTTRGRIYRINRRRGVWRTPTLVGTPRSGAYVSDIFVDANNPNWIWVTYSTIGGGHVYLSRNGGNLWQNRNGNLPNIPVNAIVADPRNARTVFVGTDNGVYRTTNAGTSWIDFSRALPNAIIGDLLFHGSGRVLRAATRSRGVWEVHL